MIKLFKKYPMALSTVLGTAVIVLSFYFPSFSLILIAALIALFFALFIFKAPGQIVVSILCVICVGCSMLFTLKDINTANSYNDSKVSGEFVVIGNPQNYGEGFYSLTVKTSNTESLKKGMKLLVNLNTESVADMRLGDIISFEGKLYSMEDRTNKLSFYSNGIYLSTSVYEYEITEKGGDRLYSLIGSLRDYISDYLFGNISYDEAATLCALTSSDRSFMSDFFYGCVKSAGVAHVMVVSGMHLSIIMVFLTKLIEKFFYNRYVKALLITLTVLFMVILCGFSASILRAGITYLFTALSYILRRPNNSTNNLGSAVTFIIMFSPLLIFNVAFQLSVLSTFGVLELAPRLYGAFKRVLKTENKMVSYITENIAITLCAMVLTLPVTVYRFGYISVVGILTNLLISSAVTWALILAAAALIINLILPFASHPFLLCAGLLAKYINAVIVELGTNPFATLDVPKDAFWLAIIIIICVFILLAACNYRLAVLKLKKMKIKVVEETEAKFKWR